MSIKYQVWTKQPGDEDFEMQNSNLEIAEAQKLLAGYRNLGLNACMTCNEANNPNHYTRMEAE